MEWYSNNSEINYQKDKLEIKKTDLPQYTYVLDKFLFNNTIFRYVYNLIMTVMYLFSNRF